VARRKDGGGRGKGPAAGPAPLPAASGDAPIAELSRDALSAFLYVALLPDETRALVKELRVRVPGFRTESLSDVERCDVLADEIRAGAEDARVLVLDRLRAAFRSPPLVETPLDAAAADDLLAVGSSDHGLVLAVWRALADPQAAVRARAAETLERLAREYYGPREDDEDGREPAAPPERPAAGGDPAARVADLERTLGRERAQAEEARRRAEAQREKIQAQLKEARAREAQAVDDAARARDAAQDAQRARERAEAALAAVQATDAAAEAQRARGAVRDLEGKVGALEARLARQAERIEELEEALRAARERVAPREAPAAAGQAPAPDGDEPEEVAATWLMPVYTREFYDSLEGWDRRIQRAAFKQAHLLAQDLRHPSLRALPLEGLPGYYRVRVATDVRLLYRRTERQNTIEILSLIDREDLDRYIKQAKTR
jgi:mRNA-degrading endonuclease RelE of RelBE toxin-antitoxin system